jgi:hypothetical protein
VGFLARIANLSVRTVDLEEGEKLAYDIWYIPYICYRLYNYILAIVFICWREGGNRVPFWKRENKICEFCGKNAPTRKVQMEDGKWKLICESCWMEKKIHPYLLI